MFNFSHKGSLSQYLPKSRNFLKSNHKNEIEHRLLHRGRENIIDFLNKLPKTKHDYGSFIVDVPLATVGILFYFILIIYKARPSKQIFSKNDSKLIVLT